MSSEILERFLADHIASYCLHYRDTAPEFLNPGQRLAAVMGAACLMNNDSDNPRFTVKVSHAYLAYLLILLQELEDPEMGVQLLLTHMSRAGTTLTTMGGEVRRVHADRENRLNSLYYPLVVTFPVTFMLFNCLYSHCPTHCAVPWSLHFL